MRVELVRLLDGSTGRDFVISDEHGEELFSARLMDGSSELVVAWTNNLAFTILRLRDLQKLAGGAGCFAKVKGTASDRMEEAIMLGTFDAGWASETLGRVLGGSWHIHLFRRPGSAIYDIVAARFEDKQ